MNTPRFLVHTTDKHRGAKLVANIAFKKGQTIASFAEAPVLMLPTYQTIQVSEVEHVLVNETLAKLNHACHPNTFVDTAQRVVVAESDITVSEELTFFYPSTEWDMAEPFHCQCGFPECIRVVGGAKYLHPARLAQYRFNPHIIALFDKAYPLGKILVSRQLQPMLV